MCSGGRGMFKDLLGFFWDLVDNFYLDTVLLGLLYVLNVLKRS